MFPCLVLPDFVADFMIRALIVLSLCATASAFNVGGQPASKPASRNPPAKSQQAAAAMPEALLESDAWRRYVLIRPAECEPADGWWAERTPGTARTVAFMSAACTLFSLPALLKNPVVFSWLLEAAARSLTSVH